MAEWGDLEMRPCARCGEDTEHELVDGGYREDHPHGPWVPEEWQCEYIDLHAAADAGLEQLVEASILRFVRESGHPMGWMTRKLALLIAARAANEVDVILEAEG